jgi:hypothetical protein
MDLYKATGSRVAAEALIRFGQLDPSSEIRGRVLYWTLMGIGSRLPGN